MKFFKGLFGRESILFIVIIVFMIIMSFASPYYLTWRNLEAVIMGLTVNGIVVIGMVILLISGGLDLSVGSTLAFSGVVTALLLNKGVPVVPAIIGGLGIAALIGLINGALVSFLSLNPFITTLGMMMAVRGAVLVVAKGRAIINLPPEFLAIGQGRFLGLQIPIYILLFLIVVGDLLLRNARFFRQVYYVGGNENSAVLNGINVKLVKIISYIIVACLAGLAGILLTARFGSASVTVGQGVEMGVITAAIIGGASLKGGEGSVLGAALGAIFMGILSNSLNLLGVDVYWQNLITGGTLVLAIVLDQLNEKRKTESKRLRIMA
ncbi:MAG: ABC transporter permease [Spirochaetes bacterium]|nr:MAG: ABC transporter permease [Spirochaetota bacterium]